MGRRSNTRCRCATTSVQDWLWLGATCVLLSVAPGQHHTVTPEETPRGTKPGDVSVSGTCDMHEITAWGALPSDKQDVVQQCIPMGHAGEKVICKSIGKSGLERLADMDVFDWDVNPETDCEVDAGGRENMDLHEWTVAECPGIEPPEQLLEEAACEDEAHSHLPSKERHAHITCVQACMFTLRDICNDDGRWDSTPTGPLTRNQTMEINEGVDTMMNHCRIAAVHGHDAYIEFPYAFIIFYIIAVAFFTYVYMKLLRAGPERAFTLAKGKGEITHNEQAVLRKTPLWDKYAPTANMFFMADLNDPGNVKELGMDAAMYLEHMRLCGKYCLVQFATLGVLLSICYLYGHSKSELHDEWWKHVMASWSYAGLSENDATKEELWVVKFGAVWQSLSLIYFVALRQKKLNRVKLASGFSEVRSTTTLWFEDVPSDLDEQDLKGWFDKAVPKKVVSVKVALDVHDLAKNIREQRKLITKLNKLNAAVAAHRSGEADGKLDVARVAEDTHQSQIRLMELQEQERPLRQMDFPGSGNIFVTFVDEMSALDFRNRHTLNEYTSDELRIQDWKCTQAPMPAELYWDNMGMTPWQRRISTAKGYILTALAFGAFCFMAGIAIFFLSWDYFKYLYSLYPVPSMDKIVQNVRSSLSLPVYYGVCGLGFLIAVLAFEEHMAHIIARFSEYERKVTKSRVQSSYLVKAYVFYLIFHVVLSVSVFYVMTYTWLETDQPRKYTVDMWGVFHMHRACLTFGVVDPMHLFEGAKFFRRKSQESGDRSKILSAEDEDELDVQHDDFYSDHFDFSKNYGETLAIFTSCNAWTLMHPTMLICGAAYFYCKMYIDMYQITRQYSRPNIQYSGRAKATTSIMLLSVVISNAINLWYFRYMEHDAAVETWFFFVIIFNLVAMKLHSQGKSVVPKPIRTRMKRSHQRKLQTSDWAESDSPETGEGGDAEEFTYQPPSPTTMEVGVELETAHGQAKDKSSVDDETDRQLPRANSSYEGSPYTSGMKGGSPALLQNRNGSNRGQPTPFDLNSPLSGAAHRFATPREMGVHQWLATRERVVSPRSSARLSVNPLAGTSSRTKPHLSAKAEVVMEV